MKQLLGRYIANKISSDNINTVMLFQGAHTKAMEHYVSPDLEKS